MGLPIVGNLSGLCGNMHTSSLFINKTPDSMSFSKTQNNTCMVFVLFSYFPCLGSFARIIPDFPHSLYFPSLDIPAFREQGL